jgi:hypothetical protein
MGFQVLLAECIFVIVVSVMLDKELTIFVVTRVCDINDTATEMNGQMVL